MAAALTHVACPPEPEAIIGARTVSSLCLCSLHPKHVGHHGGPRGSHLTTSASPRSVARLSHSVLAVSADHEVGPPGCS